jgi:hypothetical protein
MWLFSLVFPKASYLWVAAVGLLTFFWPYIKGLIGVSIAKLKGIKDPRHTIRSSSFWFDGLFFVGSPTLREIRQYSALSRSLDVIYNMFGRFGIKPEKFGDDSWAELTFLKPINRFIRSWSLFWIGMPIAQDVRSRLDIIAEEYRKKIRALAFVEPGRTIQILEVAGGQLQAVIMGIVRAKADGAQFTYRVVSIEPEAEFSKGRAINLIRHFGLDERNFVFICSNISTNKADKHIKNILSVNGAEVDKFDIVTCIGLGDYYPTPKRITALLQHLNIGQMVITANVTDNIVERIFLHVLIQWPSMKYRSLRAWRNAIVKVFDQRQIRIIQTPQGIFNIAVVE